MERLYAARDKDSQPSKLMKTENVLFRRFQGGITITLVQNGSTENEILLKSGAKSPFPFDLAVHLEDIEEGTEGNIIFNGQFECILENDG